MSANSGQLELITRHGVTLSVEAQEEIARKCKDRHDALIQCFRASMLEPKQVYSQLIGEDGRPMSQTRFSLFINRKASLDHKEEHKYMRACGNLIPLRFDAWKTDHELRPIQTDAEAKLAEAERRIAELEQKLKWTVELAVGRRA